MWNATLMRSSAPWSIYTHIVFTRSIPRADGQIWTHLNCILKCAVVVVAQTRRESFFFNYLIKHIRKDRDIPLIHTKNSTVNTTDVRAKYKNNNIEEDNFFWCNGLKRLYTELWFRIIFHISMSLNIKQCSETDLVEMNFLACI